MNASHEIHLHHLVITAEGARGDAPIYFVNFFVIGPDGEPEPRMVKVIANAPWEAIAKARSALPSGCYGWRIGSTGALLNLPRASKAARHAAFAAEYEMAPQIRIGRGAARDGCLILSARPGAWRRT